MNVYYAVEFDRDMVCFIAMSLDYSVVMVKTEEYMSGSCYEWSLNENTNPCRD
jgi:hypothetical protein